MISVENLSAGYNGFFIKDINFNVEKGEIFGIIGPNGSGKTTILRAISKVIPIKGGRVLFNGADIRKIGFREFAQNVGVVSQVNEVHFDMKVFDLVLLGRIPHQRFLFTTHNDIEIVKRSLEILGITELKNKYISQLSGGERKLSFISKALAQEPKVLLLDEPTTHLDIYHQVKILNIIKRLKRELNITIIIVLHELNLAIEYCDRLLLLNNGEVYKIGEAQEVLTKETIKGVYHSNVILQENPITHKKHILLMPEGVKTNLSLQI